MIPPRASVMIPNRMAAGYTACGVHEHWDNASTRNYSRNVGKEKGIDLMALAEGTYLMEVREGSSRIHKKLIKR